MADVFAFGDSITVGQNASIAANRYTNLVADNRGWTLTNNGISGKMILDMIDVIYATSIDETDQIIALLGYNDMRRGGIVDIYKTTFRNALYASAVWLAIPTSRKFNARDLSQITYSGAWTNNATTYGGSMSRYCSDTGTATFSLLGDTIYIGCTRTSYDNASLRITVDGVDRGDYSCTGMSGSVSGREWGPFLIRVPGLTNTMHTVVIRWLAPGAINSNIYFDWAGSSNGVANRPNVYIGDCLHMNATGYTLAAPHNNGSDLAVYQYNALIASLVSDLAGDGLNIALVPASSVIDPDTADIDTDNIHPTNQGHLKIANLFLDTINLGFPFVMPTRQSIKTNYKLLKSGNKILFRV